MTTANQCNYNFIWISIADDYPWSDNSYSQTKECANLHPEGLYQLIDLDNLNLYLTNLWQTEQKEDISKYFIIKEVINGKNLLIILRSNQLDEITIKLLDKSELMKPKHILCFMKTCLSEFHLSTFVPKSSTASVIITSSEKPVQERSKKHLSNTDSEMKTNYSSELLAYKITVGFLTVGLVGFIIATIYFALLYKNGLSEIKSIRCAQAVVQTLPESKQNFLVQACKNLASENDKNRYKMVL